MSDLIRREDVKKFVCANCICKKLDEPCDGNCAMLRNVDNIPSLKTPFLSAEEVKEVELALDKQEPVKPSLVYHNRIGLCRCCENAIDKTMKYCDQCGQKIDWEVNGDE